jgi:hypothetical protein
MEKIAMAANKLPDIAFVRECLNYNPDTGLFIWRERPLHHFADAASQKRMNARDAGKVAGAEHVSGRRAERNYWGVRLAGVFYPAHRLAWLLFHGTDPAELEVDHINGNPLDNSIGNLRLATRSENAANAGAHFDSQSRARGIQRNGSGYMARVMLHGKSYYLGTWRSLDEAMKARHEWLERHAKSTDLG